MTSTAAELCSAEGLWGIPQQANCAYGGIACQYKIVPTQALLATLCFDVLRQSQIIGKQGLPGPYW